MKSVLLLILLGFASITLASKPPSLKEAVLVGFCDSNGARLANPQLKRIGDPAIVQRLATYFPAMFSPGKSDAVSGWKAGSKICFYTKSGALLAIWISPDFKEWSIDEKKGQWRTRPGLAVEWKKVLASHPLR